MSAKTRLKLMLDAGEVRRFHASRVIKDRTVGQHTFNMLVLADNYFDGNPPKHVMKAILYHDIHEGIIGDIPRPTKQAVPAIRELEDQIDDEYSLKVGPSPYVDKWLHEIVKRIDMLEFYVYMLDEKAMGNTNNLVETNRAYQEIMAPGMPETWYTFFEKVCNEVK